MLEIFFLILAVVLIFVLKSFWISVLVLAVCFAIIAPGIYAIFSGAPFVPTLKNRISAMMRLGSFKKTDRVFELGCGDGRIIIEVAKKGVKEAIGYEFSIPTYFLALFRVWRAKSSAKIRFGNYFKKDFSNADVLICFSYDKSMEKFEKKIWPVLKKGTRVISNEFQMPNVKPDEIDSGVYLYKK